MKDFASEIYTLAPPAKGASCRPPRPRCLVSVSVRDCTHCDSPPHSMSTRGDSYAPFSLILTFSTEHSSKIYPETLLSNHVFLSHPHPPSIQLYAHLSKCLRPSLPPSLLPFLPLSLHPPSTQPTQPPIPPPIHWTFVEQAGVSGLPEIR